MIFLNTFVSLKLSVFVLISALKLINKYSLKNRCILWHDGNFMHILFTQIIYFLFSISVLINACINIYNPHTPNKIIILYCRKVKCITYAIHNFIYSKCAMYYISDYNTSLQIVKFKKVHFNKK